MYRDCQDYFSPVLQLEHLGKIQQKSDSYVFIFKVQFWKKMMIITNFAAVFQFNIIGVEWFSSHRLEWRN